MKNTHFKQTTKANPFRTRYDAPNELQCCYNYGDLFQLWWDKKKKSENKMTNTFKKCHKTNASRQMAQAIVSATECEETHLNDAWKIASIVLIPFLSSYGLLFFSSSSKGNGVMHNSSRRWQGEHIESNRPRCCWYQPFLKRLIDARKHPKLI